MREMSRGGRGGRKEGRERRERRVRPRVGHVDTYPIMHAKKR